MSYAYVWGARTCVLHMVDAHFDKVGHWCVLPLTQTGQTAAKHLICEHTQTFISIFRPSGGTSQSTRCSHVRRAAVRLPLMYPLSRTAWYVGRRVRNFLSFILVFFWSDESMLTEFFIAVGRQASCECLSFANTLNVHSAAQGHSQTYLGSS